MFPSCSKPTSLLSDFVDPAGRWGSSDKEIRRERQKNRNAFMYITKGRWWVDPFYCTFVEKQERTPQEHATMFVHFVNGFTVQCGGRGRHSQFCHDIDSLSRIYELCRKSNLLSSLLSSRNNSKSSPAADMQAGIGSFMPVVDTGCHIFLRISVNSSFGYLSSCFLFAGQKRWELIHVVQIRFYLDQVFSISYSRSTIYLHSISCIL